MAGRIAATLLLGLLIFTVGFFVIIYYMTAFDLQQCQREIAVLNTLNLQKTCEVKKLLKRASAKQSELSGIKAELESAKKSLDGTTKELASLKETLGKLSK